MLLTDLLTDFHPYSKSFWDLLTVPALVLLTVACGGATGYFLLQWLWPKDEDSK